MLIKLNRDAFVQALSAANWENAVCIEKNGDSISLVSDIECVENEYRIERYDIYGPRFEISDLLHNGMGFNEALLESRGRVTGGIGFIERADFDPVKTNDDWIMDAFMSYDAQYIIYNESANPIEIIKTCDDGYIYALPNPLVDKRVVMNIKASSCTVDTRARTVTFTNKNNVEFVFSYNDVSVLTDITDRECFREDVTDFFENNSDVYSSAVFDDADLLDSILDMYFDNRRDADGGEEECAKHWSQCLDDAINYYSVDLEKYKIDKYSDNDED